MKTSIACVLAAAAIAAAGFTAAWLLLPRVSAQAPAGGPLRSGLVRWEDGIPTRGEWGEWRRYFRGEAPGMKDLVALSVTLKPGQAPHPPHRHAEAELMIIAEGEGVWHLDGKESPARKGDAVYASPWTSHGLKSSGAMPLTYYMVKWSSESAKPAEKPAAPPATLDKKDG